MNYLLKVGKMINHLSDLHNIANMRDNRIKKVEKELFMFFLSLIFMLNPISFSFKGVNL